LIIRDAFQGNQLVLRLTISFSNTFSYLQAGADGGFK